MYLLDVLKGRWRVPNSKAFLIEHEGIEGYFGKNPNRELVFPGQKWYSGEAVLFSFPAED